MANMPMSYIALGVGATDLSQTNHDWGFFPNETLGHATHIAFGTYGPQQNLGFEVGYTNFGNVSRSGGTTRAEGINLSLIGRLPLSDTFNLMGKVGGTYGHTDISAAAGSGASTGTVDGFDWSYGVGAELALMPSVSAVLQYDEHYMKFAGDHSNRVNATTVGLRYRF
jgi:opacity protein-like surface antigen